MGALPSTLCNSYINVDELRKRARLNWLYWREGLFKSTADKRASDTRLVRHGRQGPCLRRRLEQCVAMPLASLAAYEAYDEEYIMQRIYPETQTGNGQLKQVYFGSIE